jgi:DNA-binding IclR family transcriptional regulator
VVKNKPTYGIESVDHALQLATLLQQEGPLRVTEAAARLGVARSTAHRLLAMLVYRDFAEQDVDRRYVAGPVLRRPAAPDSIAQLRAAALPHLRVLTELTGETSNLVVLIGDQVRFLASVECDQVLRVGDRAGRLLPAHLASGGKALLSTRTDDQVAALYARRGADSAAPELPALLRELRRIRRLGFAVNDGGTEAGVTAVGRAVSWSPGPGVAPAAAVSIAMPTARFRRDRLTGWATALAAAVAGIEDDIVVDVV